MIEVKWKTRVGGEGMRHTKVDGIFGGVVANDDGGMFIRCQIPLIDVTSGGNDFVVEETVVRHSAFPMVES